MREAGYDLLTGRSELHLVPAWDGAFVHREVLQPLLALREKARQSGIELAIASSFRSFDRQLLICREKVSGKRPLYGVDGEPVLVRQLSPQSTLNALLRWSALPGLSRHHWGTDLDIYDAAAVDAEYRLQLTVAEYAPGGPFSGLNDWLSGQIDTGDCCGFYRPYSIDRGGVAPEPWHISYRPLSDQFAGQVNFDLFQRLLDEGCWPLLDEIGARGEDIFRRYICIADAADDSLMA